MAEQNTPRPLIQRFTSRKFLVTLLAVGLAVASGPLGISTEVTIAGIGVAAAFITAEGANDWRKQQ